MSDWIEVLSVPLDQDLSSFTGYLHEQGVPTWVFERNGQQSLCVPSSTDPVHLQAIMLRWRSMPPEISGADIGQPGGAIAGGKTVFAEWKHFRLTLGLLLISMACFLMVATPWGQLNGGLQWLAILTLQPLAIEGDDVQLLAQLPPLQQWWRFFTPVFLHFSFFHILFNGLMMLELGRRIETAQGTKRLFLLVIVCAFISNFAQFLASPSNLFGGLSGVVYALIGYGWLYQRLRHDSGFLVAPGLMAMALFWQALCFSGLVTFAGLGDIANAAHIAGLLAGLLCGWMAARLDRPHVSATTDGIIDA